MKRNSIKIHLICWAIYIAYEVLIEGVIIEKYYHPLTYTLFYMLNIGLFYIHSWIIMPLSVRNMPKNIWQLPFLIMIEFALYIGIAMGIVHITYSLGARPSPLVLDRVFFASMIWRALLFMLYGTGYFFLTRYITKTKEQAQQAIEVEKLKTKLAQVEGDYLRAQVNPHLLFNTLNFVKYAAKHNPAQSEEAILLLSDILSFSISKSPDGLIALSDELKQIDNIIRLNQLRFNNSLQIDYSMELRKANIRILPIVLLTLVENVFKHGDLIETAHPAIIRIGEEDNMLTVTTQNLPNNNGLSRLDPARTGLKNIIARLEEEYGKDGFQVQHGKEGRYYNVCIKMPYGEGWGA